jgi:formylglycine-generating enzyme required for sulfatase activity/lipoprotein NlpI
MMRTTSLRFVVLLLLLFPALAPAEDKPKFSALKDPRTRCLQMGTDPLADEAIRVCTEALASEKKKADETALFYLNRGNAYAKKNLADKAYADYLEAIKLDERLPEAYYGRGMILLHEGDYEGAEQQYKQALELDPDYGGAKEILERVKAGGKLRERNFPSAAEAEERGDFRAAAYLYTELLESDALAGARFPTFAVHDNRANVYLAQKQYPAAVKDFSAALELNPDYVPSLYNRGSAYSIMGRFDLGVADYSRVIGLEPENASAYFNRGSAYAGMNRYQSAIRDYKKALELKPGWEKVEKTLAQAESISGVYDVFSRGLEAERKGAYDEAIARYTEVLESGRLDAGNTANIYYARARVHMRRKEFPETISDLKRAVELKPRWKALRKTLEAVEAEAKEMREEEGDEGLGGILADWLDDTEEQVTETEKAGQESPQEKETWIKESAAKETVDKEAVDNESAAKETVDKEAADKETADKETAAKETAEKETAEKETAEKETAEKEPIGAEPAKPETAVAETGSEEGQEAAADKAPAEEAPQPEQPPVVVDEYQPGESFTDCDDCPEMVVAPPGTFHMGDTMGSGSAVERPSHRVTIGSPLAVGKFEITYAQWDACVADGGCSFKPADDGLGRGARPVTGISWNDTREFLAWLSEKSGRRYRLPTEAEWEYVARSESITDDYWGDPEQSCRHANGADQALRQKDPRVSAAVCNDGFVKTAPVGSFQPNRFGIHDIYGNVAEWVEDCWNPDYRGAPTDGQAWTSGQCGRRILRGGSWKSGPVEIRASSRVSLWKELRMNTSGLRVVRTLYLQPESAE